MIYLVDGVAKVTVIRFWWWLWPQCGAGNEKSWRWFVFSECFGFCCRCRRIPFLVLRVGDYGMNQFSPLLSVSCCLSAVCYRHAGPCSHRCCPSMSVLVGHKDQQFVLLVCVCRVLTHFIWCGRNT